MSFTTKNSGPNGVSNESKSTTTKPVDAHKPKPLFVAEAETETSSSLFESSVETNSSFLGESSFALFGEESDLAQSSIKTEDQKTESKTAIEPVIVDEFYPELDTIEQFSVNDDKANTLDSPNVNQTESVSPKATEVSSPVVQEEKIEQSKEQRPVGGSKKQDLNLDAGSGGDAGAGSSGKEELKASELAADNSEVYFDGLTALPATSFMASLKETSGVQQAFNNERTDLEGSLPEIEQPTGIPVLATINNAEQAMNGAEQTEQKIRSIAVEEPELIPTGEKEGLQISEDAKQPPSSFIERLKGFFSFGRSGNDDDKKAQIKSGISQLPTSESINTSPGAAPQVDLTGQANPVQNEQYVNEAEGTVGVEQQKNKAESQIYKGENHVYPDMEIDLMSPNVELSKIDVNTGLSEELPQVSSELRQHFDMEAQQHLDAQLEPEKNRQQQGYQKMLDDQENEHLNTDKKIADETANIKQQQEDAQNNARTEVAGHRQQWQTENQAVQNEFKNKSAQEKAKVDKQIDTQVKETDKQVDTEFKKAEKESQQEVEKSNKEAARKKAEAEKESKNKSWWDRAIDAIGDFFDALKDVLNTVFDGLRALVKGIIEGVKKLVNKLIDLARDLIVGFIKVFGEILKGFVNIALAAFPELRDKFNNLIDKAVDVAVNVVNTLAEGLKKAVNFLLDALGAALDFILSVYQALYSLILDALKFIAVGIMKVLQGLANLIESTTFMPENFMGQISEEFLGMDVTQPLPFEKTSLSNHSNSSSSDEFTDLLSKGSFMENDFFVENAPNDVELDSELLTQLAGSGEISFGQNGFTLDDFLSDYQMDGSAEGNGQTSVEGSDMNIPQDPYAQADWFINYQNSQAPINTSAPSAEGKQAASNEAMPEEMKLVGPWSPGVRLYYLKEQMWAAIKKKWEENKWTYIGIGAAVVLGITALAIATGGAIFGLIPPALKIFAALMLGAAAVKASGFFKNYMVDGWAGQCLSAGKALARAVGIILVELIFILLFDSAALFKVLKTATKSGMKGVLQMAKAGTKSTLKAGKQALVATGKGFVKQAGKAKFALQSVGKGIAKGAKSLDELGQRLAKKFKFKGFKIVVKGFRFYLYGNVNPWVLLASGKIEEVKNKGGKKVGQEGKFLTKNGDEVEGILVGIGKDKNKSKFVKSLEDGTTDVDEFLKLADDASRRQIIRGVDKFNYDEVVKLYGQKVADVIKNRSSIAKNAGKDLAGEFDQAHHLIPIELIQKSKLIRKAIEGGFDFNGKINAKWLKQFSSKVDELKDGVHASHPNYTKGVEKMLEDVLTALGKNADEITESQAKSIVENIIEKLVKKIDENPTTKIDDLFN